MDCEYVHNVVNHLEEYVNGNVHTNGIENFWSLLKRTIGGTYVSVEPFHLFRYVDEQAFRFNNRLPMKDGDRFSYLVRKVVGKRLTYADSSAKLRKAGRRGSLLRRVSRAALSGAFSLRLGAAFMGIQFRLSLVLCFAPHDLLMWDREHLADEGVEQSTRFWPLNRSLCHWLHHSTCRIGRRFESRVRTNTSSIGTGTGSRASLPLSALFHSSSELQKTYLEFIE